MLEEHLPYMQAALAEARLALASGDVPVGCVIVKDGQIIGWGHNRREALADASAHAELEAIRDACGRLNTWRLQGASLYVTLEPCPMCSGGIINARLDAVYYGAKEDKMGCCGSVLNLFEERFNHHPKIYGGLMAEECSRILTDFFAAKR